MSSPSPRTNDGAVAASVAQKDLVGTVRTIAASRGWTVVDLHGSHQNPGQPSVPDLLITRVGNKPTVVKILGAKGDLSRNQTAWLNHYAEVGFATATYRPADFEQILEALA